MIYIASDHAGYELKEVIKQFLKQERIAFEDIGPFIYNKEDDYPDFMIPAAQKVAQNPDEHRGIIIGGSGQGEAMMANKVQGIRATVYYGGSQDILTFSKIHNNANMLSLGARFINPEEAKRAVKLWLSTPFPGEERHVRRIEKMKKFEE